MTPSEYQELAAVTDKRDYSDTSLRLQSDNTLRVLHAAMGLATESGEVMDAMKRYAIYGKTLDMTNLKEEVGDLLWYVALLCNTLGFSIEECMALNIEKLRARYPSGFTEHDAVHRDLDRERVVLEQPRTT